MRKLMMLVALLAMLSLAAIPALAQSASNSGDSSNACQPIQVIENEGGVEENTQPVSLEDIEEVDDIEITGSSLNFETPLAAECEQRVEQAAAS